MNVLRAANAVEQAHDDEANREDVPGAEAALSLPLSYLLLVCFGERRGPWDLLCDAEVLEIAPGRRFAD